MPEPTLRGDDAAPSRAADEGWFRRVLGHYPTGVSVVTGISDERAPVGLAVGSFTSVSLDPPLVAFLPAASSTSWPQVQASGRFCVNILASDQEPVCRAFATPGVDKFAGLGWRAASSGSPILDDAVAWIDCDLETVQEAGDHLIVVGRVRDLDIQRPTLPLLFFQGGYGRFHPHSLAIRDARLGAQLQLVDRARPLMEAAADRTATQVLAAYCDGHELVLLASAGTPDPQVDAAAIGQRIPVTPPIGIWWVAFAQAPQVDAWLAEIPSAERRERYRLALAEIRKAGYSLGLEAVQSQVTKMFDDRHDAHAEPTHEERQLIGHMRLDPFAYVPPPGDDAAPTASREDAVSLWAPVLAADGEPMMGMVMTGFPDGDRSSDYAGELLALARQVSDALVIR